MILSPHDSFALLNTSSHNSILSLCGTTKSPSSNETALNLRCDFAIIFLMVFVIATCKYVWNDALPSAGFHPVRCQIPARARRMQKE